MALNFVPVVAVVVPVEFSWGICGQVFRTDLNLSNHVNTAHNEET